MKRALLAILVLAGCSGSDLPSIEESQKTIDHLKPKIEMIDKVIDNTPKPGMPSRSAEVRVNSEALNKLLGAISGNRSDDVRINFLPTRHHIEEKKSALGFEYTYFVDVDSGSLFLNLKEFRIIKADGNRVSAVLGMSGEGKIGVTGKYIAVSGSASPIVRLSLRDTIDFVLRRDSSSIAALYPVPAKLPLKVTMAIKLLDWEIPYTHTVYLRVTDLIQPIPFPVRFASVINMPAPDEMPGQQIRYIPTHVSIGDVLVDVNDGWLRTSMNIKINETKDR